MDRKRIFIFGLTLFLAIILSACGAPQATPCPTQEPQSCPTVAAHLPPEINNFRQEISGGAYIIFTFEPGNKCSMKIMRNNATSPQWTYDIVVNDDAHLNYMVAGHTINDGYTKADLDEWNLEHPNSKTPPPMTTFVSFSVVNPMSRTFTGMTYTGKPVYFYCITQGPDEQQVIAFFDEPFKPHP